MWARVRLHVKLNRVVATDNLLPGRPVRADQVRIEPLDGVPDALAPAQSLSEVEGKMLLRVRFAAARPCRSTTFQPPSP